MAIGICLRKLQVAWADEEKRKASGALPQQCSDPTESEKQSTGRKDLKATDSDGSESDHAPVHPSEEHQIDASEMETDQGKFGLDDCSAKSPTAEATSEPHLGNGNSSRKY